MNTPTYCTVVALMGLSLGFATGCGNKTSANSTTVNAPAKSTAVDTTPKLPGTDEVRAALEKKDYDSAIAALLRVRQTVTSREKEVQYMTLAQEVKNKLLEGYGSDPKAAEALMTLRAVTAGR